MKNSISILLLLCTAAVAQPGNLGLMCCAPASVSTATFNPSDKSARITLSNGNLTATPDVSGIDQGVRTTKTITTKVYYETKFPQFGASAGAANTTFPLDGFFLGSEANGVGVISDGRVFLDFVVVATIPAGSSSDTLGVAVDPVAHLFWVRLNNGNWNGNGLADPATGAGGIDISSITGTLYGGVTLETAALTANFGGSAFAFTPPSGFGNLH